MSMVIDSYRFTAAGAAFDVETDIAWHSLWWAEGTNFAAEGYGNGDQVDVWPNESAESDLSQAVAADRPLYVSSGIGGRPAVDFVDDLDGMAGTLSAGLSQPFTLVALCSFDDADQNSRTVMGDYASCRIRTSSSGNGQVRLEAGTDTQPRVDSSPNGTAYLWVGVFDGASSVIYRNGTQFGPSGTPGSNALSTTMEVGSSGSGGGSGMPGIYPLFAVYDGDLATDGNWSAFKSWVASHYGLTIA